MERQFVRVCNAVLQNAHGSFLKYLLRFTELDFKPLPRLVLMEKHRSRNCVSINFYLIKTQLCTYLTNLVFCFPSNRCSGLSAHGLNIFFLLIDRNLNKLWNKSIDYVCVCFVAKLHKLHEDLFSTIEKVYIALPFSG